MWVEINGTELIIHGEEGRQANFIIEDVCQLMKRPLPNGHCLERETIRYRTTNDGVLVMEFERRTLIAWTVVSVTDDRGNFYDPIIDEWGPPSCTTEEFWLFDSQRLLR